MKTLKSLLVAFAITVSSASFASSFEAKPSSVTAEIKKMLSESNLVIQDELSVVVVFKVNKDMKIEIRSISSPDEEVNEFVRQRLQDQKLSGSEWSAERVYQLPIRVAAKR